MLILDPIRRTASEVNDKFIDIEAVTWILWERIQKANGVAGVLEQDYSTRKRWVRDLDFQERQTRQQECRSGWLSTSQPIISQPWKETKSIICSQVLIGRWSLAMPVLALRAGSMGYSDPDQRPKVGTGRQVQFCEESTCNMHVDRPHQSRYGGMSWRWRELLSDHKFLGVSLLAGWQITNHDRFEWSCSSFQVLRV